MTPPWEADPVIEALIADPIHPVDVRKAAPPAFGLYAWWADPTVLSTVPGMPHPTSPDLRLLYIGIATRLRTRLASNHLGRSGSSTLRRTLAGFLLDDEQYSTRRTDRVVLIDQDEIRLTKWMTAHLQVSWCVHTAPREVERAVIRTLRPPLNVAHTDGPTLEIVKSARRRYYASTGTSASSLNLTRQEVPNQ